MGLRSLVKQTLLPVGRRPHRVLSGAFRGLELELDLQNALQFWAGLYERETYSWMSHFGKGCLAGIDVGVAQGEFTLFLLKKTSALSVLAFDPSDESSAVFSRNLVLNGLAGDSRLVTISEFVGSGADGSVRLDAFSSALHSPVLVKIDVDGLELQVLEGMKALFEHMRLRIVIETHSAELESQCTSLLLRRGCRTRIVKNAWWRRVIKDQRPIEHNRWMVASNDPDCPV